MSGATGSRPPLSPDQKRDWLRLYRSENVGPATFRTLINRFGSAAAALDALPALSRRGGLSRAIRVHSPAEADAELDLAAKLSLRLVTPGEAGYPPLLAHTDAAPPILFLRGSPEIMARPAVAIVGARNASAVGRRMALDIASQLGRTGIVIASGLARGIDTAAHRGALDTGTVAVLAGGHGRVYPPQNEGLAEEICAHGALLSEMPPDYEPRGRDFPRRNRIVSGMGFGVVVVEAARRSGSLITARLAGEQGRDVFAVPGSPLDPRAEGTNELIRNGASLVRSAADILEELGERMAATPLAEPPTDGGFAMPEDDGIDAGDVGDEARRQVAELLSTAPVDADELIRQSGLPAAAVHLVLVELELAGRLLRHPGGRVSLNVG